MSTDCPTCNDAGRDCLYQEHDSPDGVNRHRSSVADDQRGGKGHRKTKEST